jgi:hypothetical protein
VEELNRELAKNKKVLFQQSDDFKGLEVKSTAFEQGILDLIAKFESTKSTETEKNPPY